MTGDYAKSKSVSGLVGALLSTNGQGLRSIMPTCTLNMTTCTLHADNVHTVSDSMYPAFTTCILNMTTCTLHVDDMHTVSDSMITAESKMCSAH